MLSGKTLVLGVTGSIAIYKGADLASKLTQAGAKVEVIMTESAAQFVSPMTFRSVTNRPVVTSLWEMASEFSIEHVALADAADIIVIAPATANIIAKIAGGIADDSLTCTVLATKAPVVIAPAMHTNMYQNQVTQENIAKLKARGVTFVEPGYGRLASGGVGQGRLAEIETIIGTIKQVLGRNGDLAGKRIVVTAGGTREAIDPVRFIGNRSSGKMGYAVAEAARDRGAQVTLVTAPTALPDPTGIEVVHIQTALQMKEAVTKAVAGADALIMAAAVADYMPKSQAARKIKKAAAGPTLNLELIRTPDILTETRGNFLRIGFAAETEDLVEHAREELEKKQLHMVAANDVTAPDSGFEVDTNRITIITRDGKAEPLPLMTKRDVADRILDRVVGMFKATDSKSVTINVTKTVKNQGWFTIPVKGRALFPEAGHEITLLTEDGEIATNRDKDWNIGANLKPWFRKHPELKEDDKLHITVIKPMERYHIKIEIVK